MKTEIFQSLLTLGALILVVGGVALWLGLRPAFAQAPAPLIVTLADVSGDSTVHPVDSAAVAQWVQFIAPSTNTNPVRWGDASISATQGGYLAPGSGQMVPVASPVGSKTVGYPLNQLYYRVVTGDKLAIVYKQQ